MPNFHRFTIKAQEALQNAQEIAASKSHSELKALHLLLDLPDWVCWLAGGSQRADEARYRGDLEVMARELGLAQRVRFLGHRSDVRRLLVASDVYCQPNERPEAFGISFVEALWARRPVVTSYMGGAPEIVDGSCGCPLSGMCRYAPPQ